MTKIEWTEATWNPATGCSKVSPGCANCYAERMAKRLQASGTAGYANGFEYTEHNDRIVLPHKWKQGRMIFVNSMSDFFHESATFDFQLDCMHVMEATRRHTYQILTKRPSGAALFAYRWMLETDMGWPPNVWLGVSVESADHVERIRDLCDVDAAVRFVSFEPLLADVGDLPLDEIDWAIVGGESGPGFRRIEPEWVDSIYRQCREQNVAFFFKQWGGITPKAGGRTFRGREWNEMPAVAA